MASSSPLLLLPLLLSLFSLTSQFPIKLPLTPTTIPPSPDPHKILHHLAQLSVSRAHHLKSISKIPPIKTPLFSRSYGGYSISLRLGTPPQPVKLILDTGSSLVWVPCTSNYLCSGCNFPNTDISSIPKFIPKSSSSSKLIGCQNPKCEWVFGPNIQSQCRDCDPKSGNCTQACPPYIIQYGLGSTAGRLLSESLDFPNATIPNFVVGCSLFSTRQPEGIAGFGRSPESLPLQLGLTKFSHCLISRRFDDTPVSSELVLDNSDSGHTKAKGVSYTPFQKNPGNNLAFQEYYYIMLRKITVGDDDVKVPYSFLVPGPDGNGGTIVDSGTTFTFMEEPVFELVAKAFEKQMANYTIAADVQNATGLRPCFDIAGDAAVSVPELVFHFKGGAKMQLPLSNYFAFLDESVICLTMVSSNPAASPGGGNRAGGPAIILGNFQQQNFYVEYDLHNDRFGFKRQDCA